MKTERSNWYAQIAVAILVIALVVLSIFLVRQYRIAARQGIISAERSHFAALIRHHTLGAMDAGLISPWMTFDYVSVSYKVPVPYLASVFQISSSTAGYPNITISHYARLIATSSAAFTIEVQNAVRSYLSGQSLTSQATSQSIGSSLAPSSSVSSSTIPIIRSPQEE